MRYVPDIRRHWDHVRRATKLLISEHNSNESFPPFLQPERRPLLSNELPPSDDDEIFRRNPIRLFSGHRMGRETGSPGRLFDQSSDDILFSKSHPICIWSNGRTLWTWGGTWDGLTLQVNDFIMKLILKWILNFNEYKLMICLKCLEYIFQIDARSSSVGFWMNRWLMWMCGCVCVGGRHPAGFPLKWPKLLMSGNVGVRRFKKPNRQNTEGKPCYRSQFSKNAPKEGTKMETQRSRLPIAAADVWAPKSDSTLISPQFQILFGGFHFF